MNGLVMAEVIAPTVAAQRSKLNVPIAENSAARPLRTPTHQSMWRLTKNINTDNTVAHIATTPILFAPSIHQSISVAVAAKLLLSIQELSKSDINRAQAMATSSTATISMPIARLIVRRGLTRNRPPKRGIVKPRKWGLARAGYAKTSG